MKIFSHYKIVRITSSAVMAFIAMTSGAAIVHAMVPQEWVSSRFEYIDQQPYQNSYAPARPTYYEPSSNYAPYENPQLPPLSITNPQAEKAQAKVQPQSAAKTQPANPKTSKVDLDKLSVAVAMTETHNCQDSRGSARLNNCHGFKRNGKFMAFTTTDQSHDYFKNLWARSYGGIFPTIRLAQIYSGNDRPTSWLKNVRYYYNKL